MEDLRKTILTEAELLNSKSRFGLFSHPTTIALGDNSLYPSKTGSYSIIQHVEVKTANHSVYPEICCQDQTEQESLASLTSILQAVFTLEISIWILKKWTIFTNKNSMVNLLFTNSIISQTVSAKLSKYCIIKFQNALCSY